MPGGAKMLLTRRSVFVLVVFSVFAAALFIVSRRLSEQCPGGPYCPDFSRIHGGVSSDTSNSDNVDSTKSAQEQADTAPSVAIDGPCTNFPDTSDILLTMKTGASEAFSKIPTQLLTNLQCLPEYYIFSDMEQSIAGHKIYDSLDEVRQDVIFGNKDFNLYFRQKACAVDQQNCHDGYNLGAEGWALDKYKFVHLAEKTYRMRPNYKWYLFTEADTYVVWSNIVDWLKRLNPEKPLYFGSRAFIANKPFAHGGSGYVMSHAAMRDMFEGKTGVANKYDDQAPKTCCGDGLFAEAVKNETGVEVYNTWPTINGEKPHTIPYAEDEWCQPIATMHHVTSEDINDLAKLERQIGFQGPLRIKDLYKHFVQPHLKVSKSDWDNGSGNDGGDELYLNSSSREFKKEELDRAKTGKLTPLQESAHESPEACRKACESLDYCLQYRFQNGICGVGKKIRHGKPVKPETDASKKYTSGWDMEKVTQWVKAHENCGGVKWPKPK